MSLIWAIRSLAAACSTLSFVEEVLVPGRLARRWIEDLFFDRRVDGQHVADRLGERLAVARFGLGFGELFVLVKQSLDFAMVGDQEGDGVLMGGTDFAASFLGSGHGVPFSIRKVVIGGFRTRTEGSRRDRTQQPSADAPILARVLARLSEAMAGRRRWLSTLVDDGARTPEHQGLGGSRNRWTGRVNDRHPAKSPTALETRPTIAVLFRRYLALRLDPSESLTRKPADPQRSRPGTARSRYVVLSVWLSAS